MGCDCVGSRLCHVHWAGAGSGGDRLGGDGYWRRVGDSAGRVEGSLGELGEALRAAVAGRCE